MVVAKGPAELLTGTQARRIALAAQGFRRRRPTGSVTGAHLMRVVDDVAVVQVDSVNVVSRSHYLPFYSRVGPYRRELLDRASGRAPRRLVEYWAHEASFVPPATHRLLRWRMARASHEAWAGVKASAGVPGLLDAVRQHVADHGPLTASQIERAVAPGGTRDRSSWGWNWSQTRRAVEFLFWAGELTSAGRDASFARRYDLPERVLPPEVARAPDPDPEAARRELIALAARALGVASARCLRDYFRMRTQDAAPAIADLQAEGDLVPVRVRGWDVPVYRHRNAPSPRPVSARALVSPFDSLVWQRERTQALFGFHYRLEIYVPRDRRAHGYYVLPFLLRDALVARVDLKAERAAGVLRVQAAWAEPGAPADTAGELAAELATFAGWLGLDAVAVAPVGDLAPALARACAGV